MYVIKFFSNNKLMLIEYWKINTYNSSYFN